MTQRTFAESLESRTFLSASPVLFNTAVKIDRLLVQIELLKFRNDLFVSGTKLTNDLRTAKKNIAAGDTSLVAPFAQLKSDYKAMRAQLLEDRLKAAANVLADQSTIKLDILKIKQDKGSDNAESIDHAKLRADRIQLQNDLIAGLDSRVATRQTFETVISNDTQAIVTAANNDTAASAALQAAVIKFGADRVTVLNKLTFDLQGIATARQTLVNDLTAAQST
jgi:hypothetical protein